MWSLKKERRKRGRKRDGERKLRSHQRHQGTLLSIDYIPASWMLRWSGICRKLNFGVWPLNAICGDMWEGYSRRKTNTEGIKRAHHTTLVLSEVLWLAVGEGPSCLLRPPCYFLSADWIITFWFHIHSPRLSTSQRNKCPLSSVVCWLTPEHLNRAGAVQKWSGLQRSSSHVIADLRGETVQSPGRKPMHSHFTAELTNERSLLKDVFCSGPVKYFIVCCFSQCLSCRKRAVPS